MNKEIKEKLNSEEYQFLKTNEHLGDNIMLLTLGGSRAYGTNVPTSDWDFRGIALNSPKELLIAKDFEQVRDEETDTTIYSFNKMIKLLTECNPNTIEILGCEPEHYFYLTPEGQMLLDNKDLFLSQKAIYSFSCYAEQQLRRMQNALARDSYSQQEKERHIMGSCMSALMKFGERYASIPEGSFKLYIDKARNEDLTSEIFVDVNLTHYPLRDYKNIWADMNNIVKDYGKLNKRNKKKDDEHLNKHAMQLLRLYLMGIDILELAKIITYRKNDLPLLMSVRLGEFQKPDKSFRPEFFEMLDEYKKRFEYAAKNTSLPKKPDFEKIEDLKMEINASNVRKHFGGK